MTIPLTNTNRITVDKLDTIAKTMALPHENAPIRLPVTSGEERTAVAAFQATATASFSDVTGPDIYALLLRHSSCPLWITTPMTFTDRESHLNAEYCNSDWNNTAFGIGPIDVNFDVTTFLSANFSTPNNAPLNVLAKDTLVSHTYFWVPKGCSPGISLQYTVPGGNPLQTDFRAQVYRWISPGSEYYVGTIVQTMDAFTPGFTFVFAGPSPGAWYRIANWVVAQPIGFIGATDNFVTRILTSASVGWILVTPPPNVMSYPALLPFNLPPEWETTTVPFQNNRTNASAALFTNVTQVLAKEGTVLASRITPSQNYWAIEDCGMQTRVANEKYFGALENGLYTFTSPSPESQLYVNDVLFNNTPGSVDKCICYTLDKLGMASAMRFNDPGTSVYGTLAITVDWHIEYRTNSVLFPTAICITPIEVNHQAQVALGMISNFYENPLHWGLIAQGALAAARMVAGFIRSPTGQKVIQHIFKPNDSKNMEQKSMVNRSRSGSSVRIKVGKKNNKKKVSVRKSSLRKGRSKSR